MVKVKTENGAKPNLRIQAHINQWMFSSETQDLIYPLISFNKNLFNLTYPTFFLSYDFFSYAFFYFVVFYVSYQFFIVKLCLFKYINVDPPLKMFWFYYCPKVLKTSKFSWMWFHRFLLPNVYLMSTLYLRDLVSYLWMSHLFVQNMNFNVKNWW